MANAPTLIGQQGNSLREAFGGSLADLGDAHSDIVVLDADVAGGTGSHHFRSRHPNRFIQCGIAEQNMIGVAAGMSTAGFKPFVTTFAVFMLRGLEQIRLSVCYSSKNVKLVASHPGLDVGPDGASAQCLEDLGCMRSLPNMTVLSPCDALEVSAATKALLNHQGPAYMRTGRSPCPTVYETEPEFIIGKGTELKTGNDLSLISCGVMTARALQAAHRLEAEGISTSVIHMPTIKPIDKELILKTAENSKCIVTCEDHNLVGGLGSAVAEVLAEYPVTPLIRLGVNDIIGRSGEPDELAAYYGIDTDGIAQTARNAFNKITQGRAA